MRSSFVFASLCTIAIAGCSGGSGDGNKIPTGSGTQTVQLQANSDGTLGYCDANNTCTSLPNPDNCKELTVTIDTASGKACQVCTAADGTAGPQNCTAPAVACDVVTIPDPDCVVCAYVNGTVIFSTCQPTQPPICVTANADGTISTSGSAASSVSGSAGSANASAGAAITDANGAAIAPAPGCTICIDASGNRVSQDCPPTCAEVACAVPACDPGYQLVTTPGDCCPHCEPITVCNVATTNGGAASDTAGQAIACPDYAIECPQGQVVVKDPSRCCGFLCQPVTCDTTQVCPQYIVDCAPGYTWSKEAPHCCGACVPTSCTSTDQCPQGWSCPLPPCACIPNANGGCDVPASCVGHCTSPAGPNQ